MASSSSFYAFSFVLFLAIFLAVVAPAVYCRARLSNFKYNCLNYTQALANSFLFFEGQRSGKLPLNQRLKWRGDSALGDGFYLNVDLVGGYYDAGDNVKFGFPMAFTTTMLSWSVLEFGEMMGAELENAKVAVRWATDYLLKATNYSNVVYVQVGDANDDHSCWERSEDMKTSRSVLKVNIGNPGSDVAGETAAALAAASLVFRESDPNYSYQLRDRAIQVFKFANNYRGSYSQSLSGVNPFYTSYSGFNDELLWAANWLYKATEIFEYKDFIISNGDVLGDECTSILSWDNKHAGFLILLARLCIVGLDKSFEKYKVQADNFTCYLVTEAKYTSGGLLFVQESNNLQYATTASFLLVTYAEYLRNADQSIYCGNLLVTPTSLSVLAKKQVDYILGDNPMGMSYMVGFGSKFPRKIHHRGSSMPSIFSHPDMITCKEGFSEYFDSYNPNPNVLNGAVVGGPDSNDYYTDARGNYDQAEAATYTVASIVGALAYFSDSCN